MRSSARNKEKIGETVHHKNKLSFRHVFDKQNRWLRLSVFFFKLFQTEKKTIKSLDTILEDDTHWSSPTYQNGNWAGISFCSLQTKQNAKELVSFAIGLSLPNNKTVQPVFKDQPRKPWAILPFPKSLKILGLQQHSQQLSHENCVTLTLCRNTVNWLTNSILQEITSISHQQRRQKVATNCEMCRSSWKRMVVAISFVPRESHQSDKNPSTFSNQLAMYLSPALAIQRQSRKTCNGNCSTCLNQYYPDHKTELALSFTSSKWAFDTGANDWLAERNYTLRKRHVRSRK